jgi:cell fate regulator YaaT (PSP1 superfamily)
VAQNTSEQTYYKVKVLHSSETEICVTPPSLEVRGKDVVVLPTKYGKDLGCVQGPIRDEETIEESEIREIIRKANDEDVALFEANKEKEREALEICRKKVEAHKLGMKLVSAHYIVEESKVLFFFTAESRVDFRELVKDLVSVFKMRIELRQIGVRDESRVLGGLGVCGRTFCCHGVTDKLKPVSIKMAKEQNLSLNSMKISGPCGRLLCCLAYEFDFYCEMKKRLPHEGCRINCKNTHYKITDINLLSKRARITTSDGGFQDIPLSSIYRDKNTQEWKIAD